MVVLALASLSSIAMSAPHRGYRVVYAAPVAPTPCFGDSVEPFDQYLASIEWAQGGGATPQNGSSTCGVGSLTAFGQHSAATNPQWFTPLDASRVGIETASWERFQQYQNAIGW
jgi:hypothetical protein